MNLTTMLLKEARARIANGWMKGDFDNSQENIDGIPDKFCPMGACQFFRGNNSGTYIGWDAYTEALRILQRLVSLYTIFPGISAFNDDPETTLEEVLELFDDAIKESEKL